MHFHSLLTNHRFPRWFSSKKLHAEDQAAVLLKQIERDFLYRGSSLIQVKEVTLTQENTAAYVEFVARPVYQDDDRLKYKSWARLFAEQVFEDTAKVLRTIWTYAPTLDTITLRVFRPTLPVPNATEETILRLHAAGEPLREKVLHWGKTSPVALLQGCDLHYMFDPRFGLHTLGEEGRDCSRK